MIMSMAARKTKIQYICSSAGFSVCKKATGSYAQSGHDQSGLELASSWSFCVLLLLVITRVRLTTAFCQGCALSYYRVWPDRQSRVCALYLAFASDMIFDVGII